MKKRKKEAPDPKNIAFRSFPFTPTEWERDRIHRYSVRAPAWWRAWMKVRRWFGRRGIG